MQIEMDVLLHDGESPDDVIEMLEKRFGITASYDDEMWNSATTLFVEGTDEQVARVRRWHNASHAPRPDLAGKPSVGKGEKRS
jgi:hypothetical protein